MKKISIFCLFFLLLFLGFWQLYRLQVKSQIIQNMQKSTIVVDSLGQDPKSISYRKIHINGKIDESVYFNMIKGTEKSKFVPFELKDGKIILVELKTYKDGVSEGYIVCKKPGILSVLFKNDIKNNFWLFFDFSAMSKIYSKTIEPCSIKKSQPEIYNHHAMYSLLWFTLAAFVGGYIIYAICGKKRKS